MKSAIIALLGYTTTVKINAIFVEIESHEIGYFAIYFLGCENKKIWGNLGIPIQ
jgi:hypothetical protein